MDIVSRLKLFLEKTQISNSKFADDCGISRPTLSQILNGRNKKISDELIGKIHDAFPSLSIMWLMFGEGNMLTANYGEIQTNETPKHQSGDFELFNKENNENDLFSGIEDLINSNNKKDIDSLISEKQISNSQTIENNEIKEKEIGVDNISNKKISSILVFYSDNTFEKFIPK